MCVCDSTERDNMQRYYLYHMNPFEGEIPGELFVGLRAELRGHYKIGHCIHTTVLHPDLHATGITQHRKAKMDKKGVTMAPASNITDAITEKVLASRSGQIFIPKNEARRKIVRSLPIWLQDFYYLHE